ncbi:MAG: hypothetical protein RLZZ156_1391 [Deinococcota bacterium]|jgi:hypothetical protein
MTLDHLVIAAPSLEIGAAWFEHQTGVKAQAGGKHPLMGTHNLLAKLGADTYLEIISIDPEAPAPSRARWFELDQPILEPRLIHWVARCDNLEQIKNLDGIVTPVTRGAYSWKITIPEDGHLPSGGVFPTLIQWHSPNPSSSLENNGLELRRLELFHPNPESIQAKLQALNLELPVQFAQSPRLKATLQTPLGIACLE